MHHMVISGDYRNTTQYSPGGPSDAHASASAWAGSPQQGQGPARILIMDDEPGLRAILEEVLEGYHVTLVDNGPDGVHRFKQEGYDLVFTDLRMPGMSGWEIARAIKEHSPETPVIMVTGWETDLSPDELAGRGVDRVLKKPFEIMEVLSIVAELIQDSGTSPLKS